MEELVRQKLGLEILCVSLPDQRLGEDLGVLIRSTSSSNYLYHHQRIQQALSSEFGNSFSFGNFIDVPEFPLNSNLKIDRKTGAELFLRQRATWNIT